MCFDYPHFWGLLRSELCCFFIRLGLRWPCTSLSPAAISKCCLLLHVWGGELKEGCEGRWARERDRDTRDGGEGMEARATGLALSPPGGPQALGVGCVWTGSALLTPLSLMFVALSRSASSLTLSAFHLDFAKEGASELLGADSRGPGALSLWEAGAELLDEGYGAGRGAPTGPVVGPGEAEPGLGAVGAAGRGLRGRAGGRYWPGSTVSPLHLWTLERRPRWGGERRDWWGPCASDFIFQSRQFPGGIPQLTMAETEDSRRGRWACLWPQAAGAQQTCRTVGIGARPECSSFPWLLDFLLWWKI